MDDIEDVRLVLRVCVLFIPISMYYALSNQQGSRWTYQASLMDGRIVRIFL
jgi:solute carrier family 15 oligopeptide transporter 1